MWINKIELQNIRSFQDDAIEFSKTINVIVGANNSGKSTILLPILNTQEGLPSMKDSDVRIGFKKSEAKIHISNADNNKIQLEQSNHPINQIVRDNITVVYDNNSRKYTNEFVYSTQHIRLKKFPMIENENFIFPFLSKRKVTTFTESINDKIVREVSQSLEKINAKIDRLSNPTFNPAHDFYLSACRDVFGFEIYTSPTAQGKRATYTVKNTDNIPLLAMGEGIVNIIGLLADLSIAENSLFLIEEPENDIHPKALKALMRYIIEKSEHNQFIITTHSNVVLKTLGAIKGAKIFEVQNEFRDRVPFSKTREISTRDERQSVLQNLGYELDDLDLWRGWLFFEESSAEKIVREHFLRWFFPTLPTLIRTFSARGISEVKLKFDRFNELFVFLNLEGSVYKNKAWLIIDSGEEENKVLDSLKSKYVKDNGWNEDCFMQLSKHNFEEYYPQHFASKLPEILKLGKKEKKKAKCDLLTEVLEWIKEDDDKAKNEFEKSASEIIDILRKINSSIS